MPPPIWNKAKSVASVLLDILIWPFTADVLSSIVLKYDCISVELWSSSSINNCEADDKLALSNLSMPDVGSLSVVFVEKL